jgi:outer membrane biosynthesis protein TonB
LLPQNPDEKLRQTLWEDFMKKRVQSLWFLSALALFLSVGISLSAQQTTPQTPTDTQSQPSTTPDTQAQPSATPEQAQPSQTPDEATKPAPEAKTPSAQPTGTQSFSGTIVKAGDKYVLQDDASGKTYDLDHQAEVQKYEGKKVKVNGTLDASGKMIHVQ